MKKRRFARIIFIFAITASGFYAETPTQAAHLSFRELGAECAPQINIRTIASLVRQESGLNPFAININGAPPLARQPQSDEEAVAIAHQLLARGINFDAGLGQINSRNFTRTGLSLATLFEPCDNLKAAAQILSSCYQRSAHIMGQGQPALRAALSCYNTGSLQQGFRNGYVEAVADQALLPVPELLPWNADRTTVDDSNDIVHVRRAESAVNAATAAPTDDRDAFQRDDESDAFGETSTANIHQNNKSD